MNKGNAEKFPSVGKRARAGNPVRGLFLIAIVLLVALAACSPGQPAALTQTAAADGTTSTPAEATPAPTASPTEVPATVTASPSPTAVPPLSPGVLQALKDAFYCLTNNINYAPLIKLTQYCPGYWAGSWSNMHTLDGILIRESLEPYLDPLDNLRWKFDGLTDVKKDERSSTKVNPIYTGMLSTTLTGDVTLTCPSGTPAPIQTSVSIPINGEARIAVYNYASEVQETIRIESWDIQGNPLEDYCSTLP